MREGISNADRHFFMTTFKTRPHCSRFVPEGLDVNSRRQEPTEQVKICSTPPGSHYFFAPRTVGCHPRLFMFGRIAAEIRRQYNYARGEYPSSKMALKQIEQRRSMGAWMHPSNCIVEKRYL